MIAFLKNLLPPHKGAVLVMDNHKAHKGKEVKALCADNDVQLAFLPSISSTLNPIERLWNVCKYRWGNYLLENDVKPSQGPGIMEDIIGGIEEKVI